MMKKYALRSAIGALALSAALCGCGEKKPVLHIFTWSDYMSDGVVEQFEADHNCRVVIDTYDSNESMYAKLKAGATGYDLIFPSSYMVKLMYKNGMLLPIDHAKIPNLKNLDPKYLEMAFDKDCDHSVPYSLTITGIGYLADLGDVEPSWGLFDRADLKGRITLLNDSRGT